MKERFFRFYYRKKKLRRLCKCLTWEKRLAAAIQANDKRFHQAKLTTRQRILILKKSRQFINIQYGYPAFSGFMGKRKPKWRKTL